MERGLEGDPQRGGQLRGSDQQVMGQADGGNGAQPAADLRAVQPGGVRLILDQVSASTWTSTLADTPGGSAARR